VYIEQAFAQWLREAWKLCIQMDCEIVQNSTLFYAVVTATYVAVQ
jgi:hypothetical protein